MYMFGVHISIYQVYLKEVIHYTAQQIFVYVQFNMFFYWFGHADYEYSVVFAIVSTFFEKNSNIKINHIFRVILINFCTKHNILYIVNINYVRVFCIFKTYNLLLTLTTIAVHPPKKGKICLLWCIRKWRGCINLSWSSNIVLNFLVLCLLLWYCYV